MKLNNSTMVISAKLINSDDGTESTLFVRKGRRQHFREEFRFQDYLIYLRLDWDDVRNGDPVLDADIFTEINGKKKSLGKRHPWHHIVKKWDEETGKKLYTFKFRNLTLHLVAEMTIAKTYPVDAVFARFAPEAWKVLEELDENVRNLVKERALELAHEKGRNLDARLEDVLEAKHEFELKKRER